MSVIMDYIASAFVFGILIITIAGIQVNVNSMLYLNMFSVRVQGNAVNLAYQLEHDILKAGYHGTPGTAIALADSTRLTFTADMKNTGTITTLSYVTGTTSQATSTENPDDFPLFRTEGGAMLTQLWGLTYFKFAYYDSSMNVLAMPVSATNLPRIREIQITFIVQSPEPVISNVDTTWPAITWNKMMVPRNLGVLQ